VLSANQRIDRKAEPDYSERVYKVTFRKKIYKSIDDIQGDLDMFMDDYNSNRINQAKYFRGKTPMQTFEDGRVLYQKYVFENSEEEKEVA